MKISWSEPGVIVSSAAHLALLIATLVAFSSTNKFDDAQEAIPIETVSNAEFNEIMKGEKTAKPAEKPQPKVERVAETETEKPTPPTPKAKIDVPVPPPPLRPTADPGQAERAQPPAPTPVTALPPPRPPDPPKVEVPKPQPKPPTPTPQTAAAPAKKPPEPEKPEAEAIEPLAKPAPKKEAEASPPLPPVKPRPKPPERQNFDQIEKLLEEKKLEELATAEEKPVKAPVKPAAKPKSSEEPAKIQRKWDASKIEQILAKDDPQSTGSAGRQLNKTAALGVRTANASRLSPTMMDELEALLQEQYKDCWTWVGFPGQQKYMPLIAVIYNSDGSLGSEPALVNPPTEPALRGLADSALRAVRRCNPLHIPAQYMPYFEEWRKGGPRVLRFDPVEMAG